MNNYAQFYNIHTFWQKINIVFCNTKSVKHTDFVFAKKKKWFCFVFFAEVNQKTGGWEMKPAKIDIYEMCFPWQAFEIPWQFARVLKIQVLLHYEMSLRNQTY